MAARVDLAAIEHAEHEMVLARERLRLLKLDALVSMGWKVRRVREKCLCQRSDWRYGPCTGRRFKRCKRQNPHTVYVVSPSQRHYRSVSEAFTVARGQTRTKCGPLSCERPPRAK